MRNLLIFILFLVSSSQLNAQLSRYRTSNSFDPSMDFEVNEYIYDHFEIGGGGHIFILVPGGHAKLRYAPINFQRIKVMGEIRGEIVTAPLAGWNYSVKLGTGFENGVGIHSGFGRSQYVSRALVDSAVYTNNYLYQNSFEFGIRWEGMRRQYMGGCSVEHELRNTCFYRGHFIYSRRIVGF